MGGYDPTQVYGPDANPADNGSSTFPSTSSSTDLTSTSQDEMLQGIKAKMGSIPVMLQGGVMPTDNASIAGVMTGQLPAPVLDTYENVLSRFYSLAPSDLAQLQQMMYQAGPGQFYDSSSYGTRPSHPVLFGVADDTSFSAYRKLVARAAKTQTAVSTVLSTAVDAATKSGTDASSANNAGRAPNVVQLTNPDDIRNLIQTTAPKVLGHSVDESTIQNIIAGYQAAQQADQTSTYNTQATGGTITNAPTASAFVEQQLRSQNPTDAATHQGLDIANAFIQAFRSNAGSAPLGSGTMI